MKKSADKSSTPICRIYMIFICLALLAVNVVLALVIISANNEIKKLESENAALRTQTRNSANGGGNGNKGQ